MATTPTTAASVPGPYQLGQSAGKAVVSSAANAVSTVAVVGGVAFAAIALGYVAYRLKGDV